VIVLIDLVNSSVAVPFGGPPHIKKDVFVPPDPALPALEVDKLG